MITCSVDFEWRSGTDIKLGLPRYFGDHESAPLCLAYSFIEDKTPGPTQLWAPAVHGWDCPADLAQHIRSGQPVRAWNAMFEWYGFDWLTANHGWPVVDIEQMRDTMAEAAAMNLPHALGQCAKVLMLEEQKDERGMFLIMKLCVPQKSRAKIQPPRWNNDPDLMDELYAYCMQDVVTEMAVARKLQPLSEYEQRVWVKTQEINLRGVPVDVEESANILKCTDAEEDRLNNMLKVLTQYEVPQASKRQAVMDWCNRYLPEDKQLPNLEAETVERWMADSETPDKVREALHIRAKVSQTSIAKLSAMIKTAAPDGTLKNMLVYHGASTGRYASKGGVNLQNIARPSLKDPEIPIAHASLGTGDHDLASLLWGDRLMDAGASTVRGVLRAKDGYRFIDADYSSVENRVASWISGQKDKVEMFAQGLDEYKVFASESLYRIPYDQVTKDQRQVSKSAVLGSMFGQGAVGLIEYATGYGVTLDLKRSKEIVKSYREQYEHVQAMWHACGRASVQACENPGGWIEVNDKVSIGVNKAMSFLMLRLPSGRVLRWAKPKVEMLETPWKEIRAVVTVEQTNSVTRRWERDKLIGSSIFQSAVQATARDIQVHGVFNAEAAGYHTVLLVHDEILCHEKWEFGSSDELGRLICMQPAWAQDLPLAYEGWESDRFHK